MFSSFKRTRASSLLVGCVLLLLTASVSLAARLNPLLVNGTMVAYGYGGGFNVLGCSGAGYVDCVVSGVGYDFPSDGQYEYTGTVRGTARVLVTPRILYASAQVYGYVSALCLLPVCPSPPLTGGIASAEFYGDFYVISPGEGILTFKMSTDGRPPVRIVLPVSEGLQMVMPLDVYTQMQFYIDSGTFKYDSLEHSVLISDIRIVPEPMTASLVFAGLALAVAKGRNFVR
ncbi:hypothetical protein [Paludibaculum fermentans]|uniref:PEP-CTERM protein-sorting domain-containing protein n=1 Tax=Paludibaculum fermentans TaxID=1473598 RepID=A0A7S7NT31_PALFE|nr:hypothetical protein [Paludibaculum fermentans]QOY89326.1 hypothetical protein IRI77_05045 [Paludibaculum fermentans]